jgi:hypothetical protein
MVGAGEVEEGPPWLAVGRDGSSPRRLGLGVSGGSVGRRGGLHVEEGSNDPYRRSASRGTGEGQRGQGEDGRAAPDGVGQEDGLGPTCTRHGVRRGRDDFEALWDAGGLGKVRGALGKARQARWPA